MKSVMTDSKLQFCRKQLEMYLYSPNNTTFETNDFILAFLNPKIRDCHVVVFIKLFESFRVLLDIVILRSGDKWNVW